MAGKRIGIRREDKSELERRAPLTPPDVADLIAEHDLSFTVQPSPVRVFTDQEYREAGATLSNDLSECDLIVGIKEVPLDSLVPGKPHLFFSHTAKGQSYNMPLLAKILKDKITLIDYELVKDDRGMRLIAFSFQAGQAGMVNSLWSLGQRWLAKGMKTPFAMLKQARMYEGGLPEIREVLREVGDEVRSQGLPEACTPLIISITGEGRVAAGAHDLLDELRPVTITPEKLLDEEYIASLSQKQVYSVSFHMADFLERVSGEAGFSLDEYLQHPELYRSKFTAYLPYLTALVNGIYWDDRFPKLVTLDDVANLFAENDPKLQVIGDVTCDVGGSIETTIKATLPDDPVFVYDPATGDTVDGFEGNGLQMMTVDILPTEIPRESSAHFGSVLKSHLAEVAKADFSQTLSATGLPPEFIPAVIAHKGALTPEFEYLQSYLDQNG